MRNESESAASTITLKIDGWTCRSCEKDIRCALLGVAGSFFKRLFQ